MAASWTLLAVLVLAVAVAVAAGTHRVLRVVDGDTAVLEDGEVVRILGIDTPERGESLYHEATVFLKECLEGRDVSLEFGARRRDSYHRLLGHLWIGDTLVSEKLVEAGMARLYPFPEDTLYLKRLTQAQRRARTSKCGVWQSPPPEPCSVYVINPKAMRFHRPDCRSARTLTDRTTASREALLDSGLAACRNCRP
jgi:micrococcal nuclease